MDSSSQKTDPFQKLRWQASILIWVEMISLVACAYYFHLTKSSPLFWVLVAGSSFVVIALLTITARKILVCPFCQKQLPLGWKRNCPSCGKDLYSDPAGSLPKDIPNQKWEAPAELMVPKPRDIHMGQLSWGATLLRRVLFLIVCGGVWFIFHKNGHVPVPIFWVVGLGVVFSLFGFKSMQTHKRIVEYGEPVPGTITEVFKTKNGALMRVRYAYQGTEYNRALSGTRNTTRVTGELVTLLIDPDKPSSAVIYPDGV